MENTTTIAMAIVIASLIFTIGLLNVAGAIDKQTAQAEQSLQWGQKMDCYYYWQNKDHETVDNFNMEECDY